MSKNSSFYAAFMCILCCSAAVALQPTVRAGSISLNSGIKPSAGNITSTTSNTNTSTDSTRGSALTKFTAGNVVPVSRPSNNNNTQPSSTALDELRTAIDNLRAAQLRLENDQLTRSQVEDAIEDTVKSLDLTTTNTPLKNTLSELRSSTQNLQSDIATLQDFNEDLDVNLDNRLKVRGLIGGDNRPPFATKTEIEPTVLAQKIVTDVNATETLSNKIKPKTEDIQAIIRQDLIDKEILTGSGALNVEKKGEVQVTEATVTNVLRNSNNFKQMVSDEVASKGYVTNDALNNKKFLSTDSATFNTLATKTDIAPATIAAGIADSESAKQALAEAMAGKIGPNEAGVKGLISNELQRLQIIDGSDQLKVASTTSVDPVTIARSIAKSADAKAELSGQIGPNTDTVDNLITQKLKDKGLVDNDARRAVLTSAELETTLASKKYATTDDLPTVDEATISAALANSQTLDNTIVQNLVNKRLLKENGDLNVAPVSIVNTVNTLNGGINDDGSLLQRIATDETLRNALKGEDGKDGSGFTFKGNITSYSELSSKTKAQGDAWYNEGDTLLYICSCDTNGANCAYPANGKGVPFRGEKGDKGDPGTPGTSAETVWYSYCTNGTNLNNIIRPLYGTSKTCDGDNAFTEEEYNALMDGSKAYCMLIAKNAREKSDYLVASKGMGKTLENIFGTGTVNNLKNNGLSASVSINGTSKKFVFACAEKYDEIMNPKSAWYSYCSEGNNLATIIQQLYDNVETCDDFTQEQYNALMGGPRAYCLSVAKNVDLSTINVKNNLKRLFGDSIISTLSSQKVATKVTLNGQHMTFVDACAQKYEEIMAGKSGEGYLYRGTIDNYSELANKSCDAEHEADAYYNLEIGDALLYICACNDDKTSCSFPVKGKGVNFKGEPGENGKPASQIYCEAHAVNYPDDVTNLTLIQKLYPNKGISSCDPSVFTQDLYAAIIGGANAYCTSLNATFNTGVSLNEGIGLKLARIYAAKKNVSLTSAKSALQVLQNKDAKQRMNDSDFSILDECIANYNSIMSGDDAETVWHAYCMETDDNNVSNLTKIITPLYSNVTSCDQFTSAQYNAIMGGARAYCLSLTQDIVAGKMTDFDTGIGKRLTVQLAGGNKSKLSGLRNQNLASVLSANSDSFRFNGKSLVKACEEKYNEIMAGADGKDGIDGDDGDDAATVWCKAHMSTGAARLTPAKMLRVYDKNPTRAAKITISNNAGYFTDLATCLAAVAADPDLMGGESASDQDFNSKNTITALNSTSFGTFNSHRNGFVASLKGAKGDKGDKGAQGNPGTNADQYEPVMEDGMLKWKKNGSLVSGLEMKVEGTTYMPVIDKDKGMLSWKNARTNEDIKDIEAVIIKGEPGNPGKTMIPTMGSDGTISWTASTSPSPTASSFNVKTAAVDAVKTSMGGSSSDDWNTLIGNRALTVNDLKNLVTSGALAVDATSGNVKFTSSVNSASTLSGFRDKAGGSISAGITSSPLKVTMSSGGTRICSGTSCQTMTASSNTGNDSEAFGDISDDPNFP